MQADNSLKVLRTFWKSEIIAGRMYGFLAKRYKDDARKQAIIRFGKMEVGHAKDWQDIAEKRHAVSFNTSVLFKLEIFLMRLLARILPLTIFIHYMEHRERKAILDYSKLLETFRDDETLIRKVSDIIRHEIGHEWQLMEQIADKESYILKANEAIHGITAGILETLGLVIGLLAVQKTTSTIGLTGLIATIGGLIAIMTIAYMSARGHYDLHQGKIHELGIKKDVHPVALKDELQNVLLDQGVSHQTAANMMDAIGDAPAVISKLIQSIKSAGEALMPKQAVLTMSLFFIMGTLPILIPFFVGAFLHADPFVPAIIAFVFAIMIISVAGLFIGVLSGKNIVSTILHNILIISGTCTITYLVGFGAGILFGIHGGGH